MDIQSGTGVGRPCRIRWRGLLSFLLLISGPAWADDPLPKNLAEAIAMEASDALPLTAFYDPPKPLPAAPPGTLIRSAPAGGYTLPPGAHAVRILYHSEALNGDDVAASGLVLIPAGAPPGGGWPVIAWAHGTSGVARICAPSLMKDVTYGDEGLMPMVAAGFAVVAADYAGLGTPGPHQYLTKIPQASDVIHSVPAARQAVPSLGPNWVAIGHSQGGIAMWGVAEREATLHDPTYRGAISVAGYMDFESSFSKDDIAPDPETGLYWPMTAFGIKAGYPSFDVNRMLTPAGLSRYRDITTKGCWYYGYAAYKELGPKALVRPGWAKAPEVAMYLHDNESGSLPIGGPLLVIAGDDDKSTSFKGIDPRVRHACALGLNIEYRHFPGLDHDPLMEKTTPEQLVWARDRLEGKPWSGNCGTM